jgi:hypothetical protein
MIRSLALVGNHYRLPMGNEACQEFNAAQHLLTRKRRNAHLKSGQEVHIQFLPWLQLTAIG